MYLILTSDDYTFWETVDHLLKTRNWKGLEIPYDKYTVVIVLNKVVGHLPKEISKTVSFFFKHGAEATCTVTDRYRHSEIA